VIKKDVQMEMGQGHVSWGQLGWSPMSW